MPHPPVRSRRRSGRPALLAVAAVLLLSVVASCSSHVDVGVEGVSSEWIDVAGPHDRRAILVTDADAESGDARPPLVVVLHGLGQDAEHMASIGGWPTLAADRGAVVVFADGWRNSWNAGTCCGDAASEGVDDVAYLDTLIGDVVDSTGADPDSVYMVGFSNGGMMTYRYMCEGSVRLRGAASLAGTDVDSCTPTRAVDFIQISGSADDAVPLDSSTSVLPQLGPLVPVRRAVDDVATAFGCPESSTTQSGPATSTVWSPCRDGVTVRLDVIAGLLHAYPIVDGYQGTDQILGVWRWPATGLPEAPSS